MGKQISKYCQFANEIKEILASHNLKVVGSNPTPATNLENPAALKRLQDFSFSFLRNLLNTPVIFLDCLAESYGSEAVIIFNDIVF